MTCVNCGVVREPGALACANCGSTNVVEPPPGSQVILSIILALIGIVCGLFVGLVLGLVTAYGLNQNPYRVTASITIDLAVIGGIAFGAYRAFVKRSIILGWLLSGIALGAILPAAACTSMMMSGLK